MINQILDSIKGYCKGYLNNEIKQKGLRIFIFHGVKLKEQRTYLHRNFHYIQDFKKIVRFISNLSCSNDTNINKKYINEGIFITFDDGYANNLIAAEILSKYKIPWTLFITTGCIGKKSIIWTVELSLLILHGNANLIELMGNKWSLHTTEQREQAFQAIRFPLKKLPMDQVNLIMSDLRQQFPSEESARLLHQFPEFQMLSWEEVRQLSDASVEIGSHGVEHAIHHLQQPLGTRIMELVDSKNQIEQVTKKICNNFAFPNGNYVQSSEDEVIKAGYKHAFSLEHDTVKKGHTSLIFPRITAPGNLSSFVENYYWVKSKN